MAIFIETESSSGLFEKIKKSIEKEEISTWEIDSDNDLTHFPKQWKNLAWFRRKKDLSQKNRLVFGIIKNEKIPMTREIYAVYHGRFIEMLISHFSEYFTIVYPSTKPNDDYDAIKTVI